MSFTRVRSLVSAGFQTAGCMNWAACFRYRQTHHWKRYAEEEQCPGEGPPCGDKEQYGLCVQGKGQEAIILNASIKENVVLPSLRQLRKVLGLITRRSETNLTNKQIETLRIKCRNGKQICNELSGGNKQKVVFAKWLGKESDILILDCPTRGIDVGVKAAMYKLMTELKAQGKSIVMISEELPELIGMSDRILLLKNGRLQAELRRSPDISEKQIIQYII